jgi:mono/diheme cytochrome c family protein
VPERAARDFVLRSAALALLAAAAAQAVHSEPYLAVHEALRCAQCHVNQTGGGMRTPFGNALAQTRLPAYRLDATSAWNGRVAGWSGEGPWPGGWVGIGANVRAATLSTETAGVRDSESLRTREARIYLDITPIAERPTLCVDQFVAPA